MCPGFILQNELDKLKVHSSDLVHHFHKDGGLVSDRLKEELYHSSMMQPERLSEDQTASDTASTHTSLMLGGCMRFFTFLKVTQR